MDLLNNELFHYTACGLDNIYLASGVNRVKTEYGDGYSMHDADDLHQVIGMLVALKPAELSSKEAKFIRIELDLSQKELAALLGVTDQTVSLWERGKQTIQRAESLILRALMLDKAYGVVQMKKLIDHIDTIDFDEDVWARLILGWRPAEEQAEDHHHWYQDKKTGLIPA